MTEAALLHLLETYKYLILVPLVALEGPLVTMLAGWLAAQHYFNLVLLCVVVVIADLLGDLVYYAVGRWGRERWLERWGWLIGVNTQHVERLEQQFEKRGGKLLAIGKISHGVGGAFIVAAGLAKMPFKSFLWFSTIATIPKSIALVLVGYYFGQTLTRVNSALELAASILVGIGLLLVVYWLFFRRREGVSE